MLDARIFWLAALVTFIITGILLVFSSSLDVRDGLGLVSFALAGICAASAFWPRP